MENLENLMKIFKILLLIYLKKNKELQKKNYFQNQLLSDLLKFTYLDWQLRDFLNNEIIFLMFMIKTVLYY